MTDSSKLPVIIVPARLASTRFPKKLLAQVRGKPLILWTAERISRIAPEFQLYFAVDGLEIGSVLKTAGFNVIETEASLASGTDRIASANQIINANSIINVQGDEPLIERVHLLSLVEALKQKEASMSTLAVPFTNEQDYLDPNQVKVVCDQNGYALYFSRAPIPHTRTLDDQVNTETTALKHLGMYGYKAEFLKRFTSIPEGRLEKLEKLEQLRALESGAKISVSVVNSATIGVDSIDDLKRFENHLDIE